MAGWRWLPWLAAALALALAAVAPALAQESGRKAVAKAVPEGALWTGYFRRDMEASDRLHWGQGRVYVTDTKLILRGKVSPGPAYKVYLTPVYAENAKQFKRIKRSSIRIGALRSFENFEVALPKGLEVEEFPNVLVWCEEFRVFITSSRLKRLGS